MGELSVYLRDERRCRSYFPVKVFKFSKKMSVTSKHTLPDLPYAYNALEPVICAEIMELHHSKHHATYVNNLNAAEEKLAEALANGDVSATVGLHAAIKFNGGGHIITPSSGRICVLVALV